MTSTQAHVAGTHLSNMYGEGSKERKEQREKEKNKQCVQPVHNKNDWRILLSFVEVYCLLTIYQILYITAVEWEQSN